MVKIEQKQIYQHFRPILFVRTNFARNLNPIDISDGNKSPIQRPPGGYYQYLGRCSQTVMEARLSWRQCGFNIFWKNPLK